MSPYDEKYEQAVTYFHEEILPAHIPDNSPEADAMFQRWRAKTQERADDWRIAQAEAERDR